MLLSHSIFKSVLLYSFWYYLVNFLILPIFFISLLYLYLYFLFPLQSSDFNLILFSTHRLISYTFIKNIFVTLQPLKFFFLIPKYDLINFQKLFTFSIYLFTIMLNFFICCLFAI